MGADGDADPRPAPDLLLAAARQAEPAMHLAERSGFLDELAGMLAAGSVGAPPPGRDWAAELAAERAIDAARLNELERATALADDVLAADPPPLAAARAWEARGRALAWTGTDDATRRADRALAEAADRYTALGDHEWAGYATFWRGNAVYLQNGDLARARELMEQSLAVLDASSPRRATVLSFYADVLISLGEWPAAERAVDESIRLADRDNDVKARAYALWSRARMASARDDAMTTERSLREAERLGPEIFDTSVGVTFLADAAELLDRVGLHDQAAAYLSRAAERDAGDEFVMQAHAALLARGGDPEAGLAALQELVRGNWLEKRWIWRHTLLWAWATFRLGRADAGPLAARALDQASSSGGLRVAVATEPELTAALAPLAEAASSAPARALLLDGRQLVVRLLGDPSVTRADGESLPLPAGQPGELVRMLAVHPHGISVESVCDSLFPDVPLATARNRLRQVLLRLRTAMGEVVVREDGRLRLVPAWVDVLEFTTAARRVRSAHGPRAVQRAYAALALWSGPALLADPYATWAGPLRDSLEFSHSAILEVIADDAELRGSHHEAITALSAALETDPDDADRIERLRRHLVATGRHASARRLDRVADNADRRRA